MLDDCKRRFSIQVGALNLPREFPARLASLEAISLRQAYESSGRSRHKNSHRMDNPVYSGEFLIFFEGRQQIPKCSIEQAEEGICEASLPLWIYKAR